MDADWVLPEMCVRSVFLSSLALLDLKMQERLHVPLLTAGHTPTVNITTGSRIFRKVNTKSIPCQVREVTSLSDPSMQCQLLCKPSGLNVFELLAPAAPDGSVCDMSDQDGICVNGKCQVRAGYSSYDGDWRKTETFDLKFFLL